jgi:hypothetical protein
MNKPTETHDELKKRLYPVELHFTKKFTSGVLEGLTAKETMRFINHKSMFTWIAGVTENSRRKRLDYEVIAYNFAL